MTSVDSFAKNTNSNGIAAKFNYYRLVLKTIFIRKLFTIANKTKAGYYEKDLFSPIQVFTLDALNNTIVFLRSFLVSA